jgi:hypothetical protein
MKTYSGIIDLGTKEQKAKLFQAKELVASNAPVSLTKTTPDLWKIYPKRNQDGSNTCCYQARAKACGILQELKTGEFVEYSASDYNKRSNAGAGAYPVEAFDFLIKEGIGLEALEPSQNMKDEDVAKIKQTVFEKEVAKASLLDGYYALMPYDFDQIISTLHATKKPIPVGFFATVKEWNLDVPKIIDPSLALEKATVRHEVCATPNYGIYNGEEGFTIEDSWGSTGINGKGVRWITRAFFEKRNYIQGLVPTSFKDYEQINIQPAKPRVKLTRDLYYGITDSDVFQLQLVLKYEGLFPANHSGSNYFGEITKRAVENFQDMYNIAQPNTAGYGRCGPTTRAFINKNYS